MDIQELFKRFQETIVPETELYSTNTFTLLIAVVLSAQSTDKNVNKATKDLFQRVSCPEDIVKMGEENLKKAIQTIGLYQTKAKHIIKLCEMLISDYGGVVPSTREELEKLPGVGRKTANVVLNVAFHQPVMPVDTHVFRVSHRLNLSQAKTPLGVEKDLEAVIPKEHLGDAHHYFILHGRYTCKAKKPLCLTCCVKDLCPSAKF